LIIVSSTKIKMAHLDFREPEHKELLSRFKLFITVGDAIGLKQLLVDYEVASFAYYEWTDIKEWEFLLTTFSFGCFRAFATQFTKKPWLVLDQWLYGFCTPQVLRIINHIAGDKPSNLAEQLDVDWMVLDGSNEMLVNEIGGISAVQQQLATIIPKHFCRNGDGNHPGSFNLYIFGFGSTAPVWTKQHHRYTDRYFKETAMTVLLMIKFRAAEFPISRDLRFILLRWLYEAHNYWLRQEVSGSRIFKVGDMGWHRKYCPNLCGLGSSGYLESKGLIRGFEIYRFSGTEEDWLVTGFLANKYIKRLLVKKCLTTVLDLSDRAVRLNVAHQLIESIGERYLGHVMAGRS